jgi:hypothetical protein
MNDIMATQGDVLQYLYKNKNKWIPLTFLQKKFNKFVGTKLSTLYRYGFVDKKYKIKKELIKYIDRIPTKTTIKRAYFKFKRF